jgi:1,4-alpha-glucan branching enzyme
MRKLFFMLLVSISMLAVAQVTTTPAIIEKGYKGEVTITFDPTGGNGGMVGATKCFAHTGLITSESKNTGDWKFVACSGWRSADTPELTKVGDKWQLVIPNIYAFYNCPETTDIVALAFVFHDGKGGSKEGKTNRGTDILIYIGEENTGDIWSTVTLADPVQQTRPAGVSNGIYYDDSDPTKVTLCTYAASKTEAAKHVYLLGDMTNWKLSDDYQLKRDGNYFWITLTGLTPGQEYRFQYAIMRADGVKKQICDLYSEKVLTGDDQWEPRTQDPSLIGYPEKGADGGLVTVIQTGKTPFAWSDATLNFKRPDKNNLVIYELWVYDYTPERSYSGLLRRLDYIQSLGVNAIELMPVCEFDGNYNWGYSPCLYFAPDKAYGTSDQLKTLIDECHKRGMAVILDMVFNHATGNNPMNKLYPYGTDLKNNPWFNVSAPHSDNVYEDWNHGFEPAHEMFTRALQYWLQEYKVDGYRLDLSHGLCSEQAGTSVGNLKDYYQKGVKAVADDAYMILEHWGSNMNSERPQLIADGMMCWNNTTNAYSQTAMGWLKDGDAFDSANQDNYVSYAESHDEERMQYKAKKYGDGDLKTNKSARLSRVAANVAMNVLLNGPHMIWQFEEIGYDYSINSDIDHPNGTSSDYRCNKKPNPETLGYFNDADRMAQYTKCAQAIQLRTRLMPNVFEGNPTAQQLGSGKAVRFVQWGSNMLAVANFSASDAQSYTLPSGTWYNYYEGKQQTNTTVSLQPGELMIFTGSQVTLPDITGIDEITVTNDRLLPPYDVTVYTLSGQQVMYEKNAPQVNLESLPRGTYVIRTKNAQGQFTSKIIR